MQDELCKGFEDASFCAGPSVKECIDGTVVDETATCTPLPDCWQDETGCVGPPTDQTYSCEDDGTCDHTDPLPTDAPSESITNESTEVPSEPVGGLTELPATGATSFGLMLIAAALIITGIVAVIGGRR